MSTASTAMSVVSTVHMTPGPEDFDDFVIGYCRLMPDTSAGGALVGPNL